MKSTHCKPLFPREKAFLEEMLHISLPANLLVFGNRLYEDGKTILQFRIENGLLKVVKNSLISNTGITFEKFVSSLLQQHSEKVDNLEMEAVELIKEVWQKYGKREIFIAFSGGKDSVVVADLVRRALSTEIPLFFADTTIEFPDTYRFIEGQENITIARPKRNFQALVPLLDPPSRIMRWCCTVCKAQPANKFLQNSLTFDGIRRQESRTRANYPRVYNNNKINGQICARPLLNWGTLDVWLYIFKYSLPYNEAYNKGFRRIGCLYCPYNSRYEELLIRHYYPLEWQKFEILLQDFAIKNNKDPSKFVNDRWWRARKPNKERIQAVIWEWDGEKQLSTFVFNPHLSGRVIEFLKPFSNIVVGDNGFRSCQQSINKVVFSGTANFIFAKSDYRTAQMIKRQIEKALNCVQCGVCAKNCDFDALYVSESTYRINSERCTQCLGCAKSKCIYLDYGGKRKTVARV